MGTAVASWSGGKESCLACHKAIQAGYRVSHLLNVVWQEAPRTAIHGLPQGVIAAQAQAMGIPLVQSPTTWDSYEEDFVGALASLRAQDVTTAIFGDVNVAENRAWDEKVSAKAGLEPVLPLWGTAPREALREFMAAGFEAVVVVVNGELLDEGWLGHRVDERLIQELADLAHDPPIDPCGENGEFHTLVVDGPLFSGRLEILDAAPVQRKGYWFLDIRDYRVGE